MHPSRSSRAGSQGKLTPKITLTRSSRSVGSPARSDVSGRLSSLVQNHKNNRESSAFSPLNRKSILNDDTHIDAPRRASWWKRLDDNSRVITEVFDNNEVADANNVIEDYVEVLSPEKKNYTLELAESSDNESLNSIILHQRKLFTQKQPTEKFDKIIELRETATKNDLNDMSIKIKNRNLFAMNTKRSRPAFPKALLEMSLNKTANLSKELAAVQDKRQEKKALFGYRPSAKRKNVFADFIVTESEDEVPEIEPKVFAFPKKTKFSTRASSCSRASSVTTDVEMDDWKMLPSSTMVEQLDENDGDKDNIVEHEELRLHYEEEADVNQDDNEPTCIEKQINESRQTKTGNQLKYAPESEQNKSKEKNDHILVANIKHQEEENQLKDERKKFDGTKSENKDSKQLDVNLQELTNAPVNEKEGVDTNIAVPHYESGKENEVSEIIQSDQNGQSDQNESDDSSDEPQESHRAREPNESLVSFDENDKIQESASEQEEIEHNEPETDREEENNKLKDDRKKFDETQSENKDNKLLDGNEREDTNIAVSRNESEKVNETVENIQPDHNERSDEQKETDDRNESQESQMSENIQSDDIEQSDEENESTNDLSQESNRETEQNESHIVSDDDNDEIQESASEQEEVEPETESEEENNETQDSDTENQEPLESIENITHDNSGNKHSHTANSVEAVLQHTLTPSTSFTGKARNTSIRKTKSMLNTLNIKQSLAPVRSTTSFNDGTKNSTDEGSGWDSHRTTRKTIRQTMGKDFSPRKSLRALVMEKSAKRYTTVSNLNDDVPQANSTEILDALNEDIENTGPELCAKPKKAEVEIHAILQEIKRKNMETRLRVEEEVKNSLKNTQKIDSYFKVPSKPAFRNSKLNSRPQQKQTKKKPIRSRLIPLEHLPADFIEDLNYKPPKRRRPNAAWATDRLYKHLESKLQPKYEYKAKIRAERLVETIFSFTKDLRRHKMAPEHAIEVLKREMAALNVVRTHHDFYHFFHEYMPREVRTKVVPDILNDISMPKNGVFSDIL